MKTLFGERKSVKTLAFILALALILPLLPVMSVGAETSAQLSEITFVNGAKDDNGYYFMSPDGKKEIYSEETDKGETLTIGNVVLSVKTSSSDIVATYSRVRQDLVFRVIGTNGTDRDDIKVKVEPTTGGAESTFYLPQNDDGTYTLPVIPPSDGVYGTNGHAKVTVESDTSSKILNLTSVATGVEISKIKLGKNKISEEVQATITVSTDYASKNLIVETRDNADSDWKAVSNDKLKVADDNPNKYTWTISALKKNMEARIKLEGTKEFNVTVKSEESLPNGVKVTGNRKVSYGGTLDINVTTPQGMQAPVINIEMGIGNDVTKSANATPIEGGYNYRLTNVTNHITITVSAPQPLTHTLTAAPTSENYSVKYEQRAPKANEGTDVQNNGDINEGNSLVVTVTPKPGYKVQNITITSSDNKTTVLGTTSVGQKTITITNITESVSVTVEVVPITITIKREKNPDNKPAEESLTFDELKSTLSGLSDNVITFEAVVNALDKDNVAVTRFGLTSDNSKDSFYTVENKDNKIDTEDVVIKVIYKWKLDPTTFYTVKSTVDYVGGEIKFKNEFGIDERVNPDDRAEFDKANVTQYGIFFGAGYNTLDENSSLIAACVEYAKKEKMTKKEVEEKAITDITGAGQVYFFAYKDSSEANADIDTSTIYFKANTGVSRSGLAFFTFTVEGDEAVYCVAGTGIGITVQ